VLATRRKLSLKGKADIECIPLDDTADVPENLIEDKSMNKIRYSGLGQRI
jgi:hypothetical protein